LFKTSLSKNRTFKIDLNTSTIQCMSSIHTEKEDWLWHYRFGHLNFNSLNQLGRKSMVSGLPMIQHPKKICEGCVISKHHRKKFLKEALHKARQPLGVVYSNVCGPFSVESLGRNKYFLIFVDEYTRMVWLYLLKEKKEVFFKFVQYCNAVERYLEKQIKILGTDGGDEFNPKQFAEFCAQKGIKHEMTPPYTPQHNSLAERRNRTLLNMTRCMLRGKNLPHYFWGEAVSTATYVSNRCPTKKLQDYTPKEAWIGIKRMVHHLRVFGSLAYGHVPKERRKKLDDRSESFIFVGYHPTGTYKLYNPITNKVVIIGCTH